jgi:hypothetical protein
MDAAKPVIDAPAAASVMTLFAGLCLAMSLFFPRFLVALPILACLGLAVGAFLRKERARIVAALIAGLAALLLGLSSLPPDMLAAPADVTYSVTGSARLASITMTNGQGGTEQQDVALPWSQPVIGLRSGQFVSLSVQNGSDFGDVTCEIRVNGTSFKTSTSSAPYGIADCSGDVP